MFLRIYPENPNEKAIAQLVDILHNDGVIIYPTDSVYALGCSLSRPKAIEKLQALTGKTDRNFSIICADLSTVDQYAKVDNPTFKSLKRNLPGPFTFILNASNKVPDKYLQRKKTIGIRIPDHNIPLAIVATLGHPLVTTSVKAPGKEIEYTLDPSLIDEVYGERVEAVVDGGKGHITLTTVVDCTGEQPEIIREGSGKLVY